MNAPKKNIPINDLIFRELIKRGYSLEGKTRVWNIADSKLWYITPAQAQAFLDLEQSEDYQSNVIQKEIDLINGNMRDILQNVGTQPLNIIDLGCGDGKKAVLFIDHLKDKMKIRYCPVDISDYMVEQALKRIKSMKVAEVMEFQWNISDFENMENISSLLRHGNFKKHFVLLLGNTLGNFEINELLYEIKSAMNEDDFLLIGNGLRITNSEETIKAYNNKYLDSLLVKTLTQIGLDKNNLEYGARFRNSRIEMYYSIKNDCEISFLGKRVIFSRGDQIIVATSYKYDKKELENFLKLYFSDIKMYVSKDSSYALALCKI